MQDLTPIIAMTLLAASAAAGAEVVDSDANGFTIRHVTNIPASRGDVYEAAIEIGRWWNGDHTVSGDAANLYLEPRPQGCFCERLGEAGGLTHLTVSFVNPGVMLRLSGGLGPLGLMGVNGNMTWEFEDREAGTSVTLTYAVGGYIPQDVRGLAEAVDYVLMEQMQRLKAFVQTGQPAAE